MWPGTCHLWCLLLLPSPALTTSPHLHLLRNLVAIFDNMCARCGDCRLPFALTRVVGGIQRGGGGEDCHRKFRLHISIYICVCVCVGVWVDLSVCVCHFAVGSLGFAFCLSCGICLCLCMSMRVCVLMCVTAVRATARGLIERLFRPWASSPWHCGHIEMPWRILGNYECLN